MAFFIDLFGEKEKLDPNMFSSNFDDVDRKRTSYDDLVCTPKLYPYATGNSGPTSAVRQSLAKSNLTTVS